MAALVVIALCPLLTVVRSQHDQRVGIVQARSVVETVEDDDPRDGLHAAEVHLPPRIRVPSRVERVLAILDAVDGAGRVALSRQRFDERLQPVLLDQLAESDCRTPPLRGCVASGGPSAGGAASTATPPSMCHTRPASHNRAAEHVSWALFRVATDS